MSIPFSVLATFVLMQFAGLTLNIMSLGGLALGVGMMVDNSIVVIENIYRHLQHGLPAAEAAARGTNEVGGAITGSTLTTVAVFLPVVYVGGITGELFRELAWTVSFSLLASLLVAVTVIPMLAAKILPWGKLKDALRPKSARGKYARAVGWALNRRWIILAAVGAVVAFSILPFQGLGREFLPSIDEGSFSINLTMPVGTPLETTAQVAQDIENILEGHEDVAICSTQVGGSEGGQDMAQRGKNSASIDVRLVPAEERKQSTEGIMAWARQATEALVPLDTAVSVQRQDIISALAGSSSLVVNVQGKSLTKVQELAEELTGKLKGLPALVEVTSSLDDQLPEQQVVIQREQAAIAGLVPAQIAAQVGAAKNGQIATRLNMSGSHVNVRVQCTGLDTEEALGGLMLTSANGGMVPLRTVADIVPGNGPMTLHRINQQVTAQISAIIQEGDLGSVSDQVQAMVEEMDWPQGYSASIGGASQLMLEGFDSLYMALGLAVILVYMLMAALFESLLHPLVIILTLPLAAVGAVLALYFSGYALGITALIGIIMLAGIVVNNAIVMVDAINQLRAQGMALRQAIITGASQRLRPILMTAFTTIIAMLPLAMGVGEGAELQAPLAAAVLGGLAQLHPAHPAGDSRDLLFTGEKDSSHPLKNLGE
ncbi:MAG: efflux RND transporter permease subunit [Bacillota bacterium]